MNSKAPGKIVVLSDLHLWGAEDPLYRGLLRFIDSRIGHNDRFFIVGDLFDLFVGGKKVFLDRYQELLARLRKLNEIGVEIFYIEGNHDFHVETIFEDSPHVRVASESFDYEWDGRRFHFCHGDRVNKEDFGYRFFHFATHNLVSQLIIHAAPGTWVDKVGQMMSRTSRGHNAEEPHYHEQVVQLFRNYACEQIAHGFDFVVMGHTHYVDDMRFRVGGHEGQYVNNGYPRKHRKYLELRHGEEFFQVKSWDDCVIPIRPAPITATES